MADKLTWIFEVLDKVSGPTTRATKAIDGFGAKLGSGPQGAQRAMRGFDQGIQATAASTQKSASIIDQALGFVSGQALIGAATSAASMALAGGKWAVSTLAFRENTMAAFKVMLGSTSEAEKTMGIAQKFAAETGFTTNQVVGTFQKLITAGFRGDELSGAFKAVGDVGANMGVEKMDSVINAFMKIRANGKLVGEAMEMLGDAGISQRLVYENLAKTMGKTVDEVIRLKEAGKISDAQGIGAIMETIRTTQSGGELGGAMKAQSQTLTGLWSTLASAPTDLFMALDKSGVFDGFVSQAKSALKLVTGLLDPDSETGKMIGAFVGKIADGAASLLQSFNTADMTSGLKRIGAILGTVWDVVTRLGAAFSKVFGATEGADLLDTILTAIEFRLAMLKPENVEAIGTALGWVVKAGAALLEYTVTLSSLWGAALEAILGYIGKLVSDVWQLGAMFVEAWSSIPETFGELGGAIVQGLISGLLGGIPGAIQAVSSLGGAVVDAAKGVLGIASPSKVFQDIGMNTGLGFAQGVEASGMGDALSLGTAVNGAAAAGAGVAGGASAAGGVSITGDWNIAIQVDGDASEEGGRRMATAFKDALAAELGKLGLGFGG